MANITPSNPLIGIGCQLEQRGGVITVRSTTPGGHAAAAGLAAGSQLLAIDRVAVTGRPLEEVQRLIAAARGAVLELIVKPPGMRPATALRLKRVSGSMSPNDPSPAMATTNAPAPVTSNTSRATVGTCSGGRAAAM